MRKKFSRGIWISVILLLAVAMIAGCGPAAGPAGPARWPAWSTRRGGSYRRYPT
jgi:hypothetical protein